MGIIPPTPAPIKYLQCQKHYINVCNSSYKKFLTIFFFAWELTTMLQMHWNYHAIWARICSPSKLTKKSFLVKKKQIWTNIFCLFHFWSKNSSKIFVCPKKGGMVVWWSVVVNLIKLTLFSGQILNNFGQFEPELTYKTVDYRIVNAEL